MLKQLFYPLFIFCIICFPSTLMVSQVIYNAYAKVTSISSNTLALSNVNQANHTFNVGENVIVMQMQDDVIGANTGNTASFGDLSAIASAGSFEIAKISAVNLSAGTPTSIAVSSALVNSYNTGANSSVQVITFRSLSATAFTSTNSISGLPWDGNVGGVIAIQVGTVFTLGHSISADGLGFNGGQKNVPNFASTSCDPNYIMAIGNKWAGKGEGIYKNTNSAFTGARGKILTGGGGGNDENSGGGGGGNFTAGGMGGPGYTGGSNGCTPTVGGLGGISLNSYIGPSRVYMGGGGGAGHENNSVGTVGGNGGGIILLKTGTLVTTGSCGAISISANGITSGNAGNDGAGGGGAGGSIIMQVSSYSISSTCTLSVSSNGGTGGDVGYSVAHGAGAGGGQGVIIYSIPQPTANVTSSTLPGNGGSSCTGCPTAINGQPGSGPSNSGIITGAGVLPIELIYFNAENRKEDVGLSWATATQKNTDRFVVERSVDFTDWTPVCSQKAAGNCSAAMYYEDADKQPLEGISYYRLKTIDVGGAVRVSKAVDIHRERGPSILVYPNPASELLNIVSFEDEPVLTWQLLDISGKAVTVPETRTGDKIILTIRLLEKGIYVLKVSNGTDQVNLVQKIVVQ